MTKDEALALALEALIHKANMIPVMQGNCYVIHPEAMQAVIDEAIKQARSAPVQEPVAWMQDSIELYVQDRPSAYYTIPLYTTPPAAQRQWVGLTDVEVMQTMSGDWTSQFYFARAIETKLKELNT